MNEPILHVQPFIYLKAMHEVETIENLYLNQL